jgi:hypothetical protein
MKKSKNAKPSDSFKMFKVNKPPLPSGLVITRDAHYRSGPIFDIIVSSCYGKCYLCEDDKATSLNIEHRIPHEGNAQLKYDYSNLYLSCAHCNMIKGAFFKNIIDPSLVDPEDVLRLTFQAEVVAAGIDEVETCVDIMPIKLDTDVLETMRLLYEIYNGSKTSIQEAECRILRRKIHAEIEKFITDIFLYKSSKNNDRLRDAIKDGIADSSQFSAFKKEIVRSDADLYPEFASLLAKR